MPKKRGRYDSTTDWTGSQTLRKWEGKPRSYTLAQLSELQFSDIARMSTPERAAIANSYAKAYAARMRGISKAGEESAANEVLLDQFESLTRAGAVPGKAVTRTRNGVTRLLPGIADLEDPQNELMMQIGAYRKFFDSKTATTKGIRQVNLAQDKEIFGTDKRGRPLYRMNNEERKAFWKIADAYREGDHGIADWYAVRNTGIIEVFKRGNMLSVAEGIEYLNWAKDTYNRTFGGNLSDRAISDGEKNILSELWEMRQRGSGGDDGQSPFGPKGVGRASDNEEPDPMADLY